MTHSARLAREDAIRDALRAADAAIGQEEPSPQAMRIIDEIKRLRSNEPARVPSTERIDYMERAQAAARAAWQAAGGFYDVGETAGVDTPLGRLRCTTWRTRWHGGKIAWRSEYSLNDEIITVAEIKAAGLARRPTTRRRQKKEATK